MTEAASSFIRREFTLWRAGVRAWPEIAYPTRLRLAGSASPRQRITDRDHDDDADNRRHPDVLRRIGSNPRGDRRVLDHHFTRDVAKEATAGEHQYRKALDQPGDDLAADNDDRDADDQTEHD